jgi:hypothetical protein
MDNVQKHKICINVLSSQTFRSYLRVLWLCFVYRISPFAFSVCHWCDEWQVCSVQKVVEQGAYLKPHH